ncbi:MAG: hypothetical protein Q7Q71_02460 [Verrucomicrobiota bacterium JB023]|nr:hypothetical protein [Verrucomicrobiota bacterium JB023]
MIPLDPEEIFAGGIWETLKRFLVGLACLYWGSLIAIAIAVTSSILKAIFTFNLLSFSSSSGSESLFTLIYLPILPIFTVAAPLAAVNILAAFAYFITQEEPKAHRFQIHASIHLLATLISFELSPWSGLDGLLLWALSPVGFYAIPFLTRCWLSKQQQRHEEHLMEVAIETMQRRAALREKEFIPAPPKGTPAPKLLRNQKEGLSGPS